MQDRWILVNEYMQTSNPDIFAGGDVIMVRDQLTGQLVPSCTWSDAMLQGLTAAHTMAGQPKEYPGVTLVTSSAFFGVKFATCGPVVSPDATYEVVINNTVDFYHKFILLDGVLQGFLLVGATQQLGTYRRLLLTRQKVETAQLQGI